MLTLILVTLGMSFLVFGSFYLLHKQLKKENDKTKPIYGELLLKAENIKTLDEAKELRKSLLDKFFTLTPRWAGGDSKNLYTYEGGSGYKDKILKLISELNGVIYYLESNKVYTKQEVILLVWDSWKDILRGGYEDQIEDWIKENIG